MAGGLNVSALVGGMGERVRGVKDGVRAVSEGVKDGMRADAQSLVDGFGSVVRGVKERAAKK